ncbi:UxaA family hydrolase, partial [Pleomorphomonas sp. NRK KF1]|uniref:UxaA family hydrolase n=1 Tax=Pleomorphomonas sp. NRK KF1 TaxID=2943000 RepID=UPI0020439CBC
MPRVLKIHPDDSVAVALEPLEAGTDIPAFGLTLRDDVPQAHKFALKDIAAGDKVIKYGAVIGLAREAVPKGAHVHVHNLKTALGDILDYQYAGNVSARPQNGGPVPTISAYERVNGDIGIRNDLFIVPLVGCINGLAD